MNIQEKHNVLFRLISCSLILSDLGLMIYTLILIIQLQPEQMWLNIATVALAIIFIVFELILFIMGGKKDSFLYKIIFNENKHINNVPLIAAGVASAVGLGLIVLGTVVYFLRFNEVMHRINMLVIICVASYLVVNCLILFIYAIIFKDRPVKLEDLIK